MARSGSDVSCRPSPANVGAIWPFAAELSEQFGCGGPTAAIIDVGGGRWAADRGAAGILETALPGSACRLDRRANTTPALVGRQRRALAGRTGTGAARPVTAVGATGISRCALRDADALPVLADVLGARGRCHRSHHSHHRHRSCPCSWGCNRGCQAAAATRSFPDRFGCRSCLFFLPFFFLFLASAVSDSCNAPNPSPMPASARKMSRRAGVLVRERRRDEKRSNSMKIDLPRVRMRCFTYGATCSARRKLRIGSG